MVTESRANRIKQDWETAQARGADINSFGLCCWKAGYSYKEFRETFEGKITPDMPELFDWKTLPELATGIYLLGDPGSGKTTTIKQLIGLITRTIGASQVLVIDLHNQPGKWHEGCLVIDEPDTAIEYMRWLLYSDAHPNCLEKRKRDLKQGTSHPSFIWVIDEIGDIRLQCQKQAEELRSQAKRLRAEAGVVNKEDGISMKLEAIDLDEQADRTSKLLGDFMIALGAQGRKYGYLGIAGNQAANTAANGMAGMGDYLESYIKIFTGRLVDKWAKIYGVSDSDREWLSRQGYPCMVGEKPALHLTHYHYQERKKKQPPCEFIQPVLLPIGGFKANPEPPKNRPVNVVDFPVIASDPTPEFDHNLYTELDEMRSQGMSITRIVRERDGLTGGAKGSKWYQRKELYERTLELGDRLKGETA